MSYTPPSADGQTLEPGSSYTPGGADGQTLEETSVAYGISGTITRLDGAAAIPVLLIERTGNTIADITTCNGTTGEYAFEGLDVGTEYAVVVLDSDPGYNGGVLDHLTPAEV